MKRLNNNFKILESDAQIVKTVNNNLLKQVENTERKCWANAQYLWRTCVEVIGTSKLVSYRIWNTLFVKFLIALFLTLEKTEQRHLTKFDRTIVKFSQRKDCQHLMGIKKGLGDLNPTNLSFSLHFLRASKST